jgi:hypothetical protein
VGKVHEIVQPGGVFKGPMVIGDDTPHDNALPIERDSDGTIKVKVPKPELKVILKTKDLERRFAKAAIRLGLHKFMEGKMGHPCPHCGATVGEDHTESCPCWVDGRKFMLPDPEAAACLAREEFLDDLRDYEYVSPQELARAAREGRRISGILEDDE